MSERVSQYVLLCEDDAQEMLVRAYLRRGGSHGALRPVNASRMTSGGNVGWVIDHFAAELHAARQRHRVRASTLLIAVVDADHKRVSERFDDLPADPPLIPDDPIAVLIPKRHVETWIRVAAGAAVDETTDYKRPAPTREQIRAAGSAIYDWARRPVAAADTMPPSLVAARDAWRKIS